jgi:hypothetical protein
MIFPLNGLKYLSRPAYFFILALKMPGSSLKVRQPGN